MKQLGGVRKVYASKGDDTTLTRWIKEPHRHTSGHVTTPMPADAQRTRFLARVLPISAMSGLLVSGHSNVKIGRDVRSGRFQGYWIYTLSLEERATCPTSCAHWTDCYGNAMPFAKRIDHTDPAFLPALEAEIKRLLAVRGRAGILIRLHALGDFYSVEYVEFWERMLFDHPRLAIFGYTARQRGLDPIGDAIHWLKGMQPKRFRIRWSDGADPRDCTVGIARAEDCPPDAFVCPEQTGRVATCASCGACWTGDKNVAFIGH